jgi:hypothetical protein
LEEDVPPEVLTVDTSTLDEHDLSGDDRNPLDSSQRLDDMDSMDDAILDSETADISGDCISGDYENPFKSDVEGKSNEGSDFNGDLDADL